MKLREREKERRKIDEQDEQKGYGNDEEKKTL